jgi:nitric oxide reductase subunit C
MPTWSEEFGGPLRDDQVQALVAYIMNWGQAYAGATPVPQPTVVPVGTDITVALPAGDAASGQARVTALGCTACHISTGAATLGPDWMASGDPNGQGIGTRAEGRLDAADYEGAATNGDQYLFESIVAPDAYLVPGNATYVNASNGQSIMPHNYATLLDAQMLADVIAYLQTLE